MKVRFALAVMMALALSIGRAHATPYTIDVYETKDGKLGGTPSEVTDPFVLPGLALTGTRYTDGFYLILEAGSQAVTDPWAHPEYWSDVLYVDAQKAQWKAQFFSDSDEVPGWTWADYKVGQGMVGAGMSLTDVISQGSSMNLGKLGVQVEGPPTGPAVQDPPTGEWEYDTVTTFVDPNYGHTFNLHSDAAKTPEPATILLLGTGALFGVLRRRRKTA